MGTHLACWIAFGKYPYMRWNRLLLLILGVAFVLLGLFADVFIARPRRALRLAVILLGAVAAFAALWQR
jgi:hypothetical protein